MEMTNLLTLELKPFEAGAIKIPLVSGLSKHHCQKY